MLFGMAKSVMMYYNLKTRIVDEFKK